MPRLDFFWKACSKKAAFANARRTPLETCRRRSRPLSAIFAQPLAARNSRIVANALPMKRRGSDRASYAHLRYLQRGGATFDSSSGQRRLAKHQWDSAEVVAKIRRVKSRAIMT